MQNLCMLLMGWLGFPVNSLLKSHCNSKSINACLDRACFVFLVTGALNKSASTSPRYVTGFQKIQIWKKIQEDTFYSWIQSGSVREWPSFCSPSLEKSWIFDRPRIKWLQLQVKLVKPFFILFLTQPHTDDKNKGSHYLFTHYNNWKYRHYDSKC